MTWSILNEIQLCVPVSSSTMSKITAIYNIAQPTKVCLFQYHLANVQNLLHWEIGPISRERTNPYFLLNFAIKIEYFIWVNLSLYSYISENYQRPHILHKRQSWLETPIKPVSSSVDTNYLLETCSQGVLYTLMQALGLLQIPCQVFKSQRLEKPKYFPRQSETSHTENVESTKSSMNNFHNYGENASINNFMMFESAPYVCT